MTYGRTGIGSGRRIAMATGLTLSLVAGLLFARGTGTTEAATPTGSSVIVLIGDGMGPDQRAATQLARYGLEETQPMDSLPVSGSIFTQSTNAITTPRRARPQSRPE